MNNSIKILMTINLESSVLVRQNELECITCSTTKQNESNKKSSNTVNKKTIKDKKDKKVYHRPLVAKLCTQHIKITKSAYKYFISDCCPSKKLIRSWGGMTISQRLEWHLQELCSDLRGLSYNYEILED